MKQVVAALIVHEDKILICQRTRHQPMPLKWEFPGGKVEPEEPPTGALSRELDEELGIRAVIGPKVTTIRHQYDNGTSVELHFYVVREYVGEIQNRIFRDLRWVTLTEMPSYDFLEADVALVRDLGDGKLSLPSAIEQRKSR
ncbi:MAG TPA: (deoxy)nucleoside triphosphate pyrophosphohydrolase [Candidatus Angelobacter sp.]